MQINFLDNVNLTGAWTLDLKGDAPEQMKLYLIQNEDVVMGQGVINRGNKTENATASGSIYGQKLSLTVMPVGVLDLYKLNLSLSTLAAAGTYAVYMADGRVGPARSHSRSPRISSSLHLPSPKMELVHIRPRTLQLRRQSSFRGLKAKPEH